MLQGKDYWKLDIKQKQKQFAGCSATYPRVVAEYSRMINKVFWPGPASSVVEHSLCKSSFFYSFGDRRSIQRSGFFRREKHKFRTIGLTRSSKICDRSRNLSDVGKMKNCCRVMYSEVKRICRPQKIGPMTRDDAIYSTTQHYKKTNTATYYDNSSQA